MKTRSISLCLFLSLLLLFCPSNALWGQIPTSSIYGQVADPTGAVIPNATISVLGANGQTVTTVTSSASGSYEIHDLAAGTYTLQVTAQGFAVYSSKPITIAPGQSRHRNISLAIQTEQQQVVVSDQELGVSTESSNNASAIVIKGKDLDALSDDPDQLQDELNALAGPSAGPNGGQIYIDGFSGGQLPPKSAIREIRVNANPFTPEYDKLGYGRIEILTKPGSDKLHGFFMVDGTDSAFNSNNPFLKTRPDYYSYFLHGSAGGPLNKNASWFTSLFRRSTQDVSVVNATTAVDSAGNSVQTIEAVPHPRSHFEIGPRFDFQLGQSNTLTVRYEYERSTSENNGVGQLALPEQGYNSVDEENTIQISDTQVINSRIVNETRFQYHRERSSQLALYHTPTISVQGRFTGGGSNSGDSRDNSDFFELQNYSTASLGSHTLRFGTRLRADREASYSTAGINGRYTYSDLASYQEDFPNNQQAGTPKNYSQYQITTINRATTRATLFDGALFIGDDWRVNPKLTLSYGLRVEGQNHINNHFSFAPRMSFAWALDGRGNKPAKTVLRGGYGWFYDRFPVDYVMEAIRLNGLNQSTARYAGNGTDISSKASVVYNINQNLQAPNNMQAAVGLERQIAKIATASVTYINSRGVHALYTNNISAIGNVDASTLPLNIYQFESGGIYKQNQVIANFRISNRRLTTFGFYMFNHADSDTSGANYFPSNPSNPSADYGRTTFSVTNRFVLGGNIVLPYEFALSPFMVANSGTPYNIVAADDLNGDGQFNDRPSFATCDSTNNDPRNMYKGHCFNLTPGLNDPRIPINYGDGPSLFSMNLRVSKTIGIGPKIEGGQGGGGGMHGGGGRHMGGGLGPGGLSGNAGGPPRLGATVPRRYSLTFIAMGRNIFNNVNLSQPNGVVGAETFTKSTALAGGFFGGGSANRSIDLQMSFSF